jgi:alpha-ketoglutarate-dependent taurine dioxygenase
MFLEYVMKITKIDGLGNYGVYIDDVDFEHMTDDQWMEIGDMHMKNLVTIIRDCNLSWEKQLGWIKKLGNPRHIHIYNLVKKYAINSWGEFVRRIIRDDVLIEEKDKILVRDFLGVHQSTPEGVGIARVSGKKDQNGKPLGLFDEGELLWHSNEAGNLTFTPGVALLGAECVVGSSTGFLQTADYYESASNSFKSELDEMILIHRYAPGKVNPTVSDHLGRSTMCPVDDTEIPMVIQSPGGIKGLHYPVNTVHGVRGMGKNDSDKVFEEINKHLFVDEYIFDHWYKNEGDLLLFDNSITLHRRLGNVPNRLGYRIQHDYSKLQDNFWQPYFQKEFAEQYEALMTDFVTTMGIEDFKLPN